MPSSHFDIITSLGIVAMTAKLLRPCKLGFQIVSNSMGTICSIHLLFVFIRTLAQLIIKVNINERNNVAYTCQYFR